MRTSRESGWILGLGTLLAVVVTSVLAWLGTASTTLAVALAGAIPAGAGILLAILTWEYLRATRDLAASSRSLERLAKLQEERMRPEFVVENVEAVPGTDTNVYVHFDLLNSGWKDCGIRTCTAECIPPGGLPIPIQLSIVQRNRAPPTQLDEGVVHQPQVYIPERDLLVRAGDRRRLTARGRPAAGFDQNAGWQLRLVVRGVLPTEASQIASFRARQAPTQEPGRP